MAHQVNSEIRAIGDAIVRTHDGQMQFNLTEARKIVGCGENSIASELHKAGILVKRRGKEKLVTAYDLAAYMSTGRVAPIDVC